MTMPANGGRSPIHVVSYRNLLVVPALLAAATGVLLFAHSDVNTPILYSQCQARSRVPWLSHLPGVGAPACFIVSFFQEALASARASAIMSVILSFVSGLVTVYTVEAARVCNQRNRVLAHPTGPLLLFNLLAGALVWQVMIVPASFYRFKQMLSETKDPGARHLARAADALAIPSAVALGFATPSLLMLILDSPVSISVWLFFPIYVSIIRKAVHFVLARSSWGRETVYLESHVRSLLSVYAVPVICSALSHGWAIWSMFRPDDRQEMTRSTLKFIEIDFFFIAVTVLYWIFVEAGWKSALVMVGISVLFGPGAGLCVGWIDRERRLGLVVEDDAEDVQDEDAAGVGEETPLL